MHPFGLQMTSDKPAVTASTEWAARVYELQKTDPVEGGADGIDNLAINQLAARTNHLRVTGIAAWMADLTYPAGGFCQVSGAVYRAIVANTGKAPASNPTVWERFYGTASEMSTAGFATIDESNKKYLPYSGGTLTGVLLAKEGQMNVNNTNNVGYGFASDPDTGLCGISDGVPALVSNGAIRWQYDGNGHHFWIGNYRVDLQDDGNVVTRDSVGNVVRHLYDTYTQTQSDARYAATTHAHTTAQVSGLDAALASKAAISHTHDRITASGGNHLVAQNDNKIVLYTAANAVLFDSSNVYNKGDTDSRYAKVSGTVMQGVLCALSGSGLNAGIKGSGDNDTGREWPADGSMQDIVNGVVRALYNQSGTFFYNNGFRTDLQVDGNLVLRDGSSNVLFSAFNTVPKDKFTSSPSTASGWRKVYDSNSPSGFYIEQWGFVTLPTGTVNQNVPFPIVFPNGCIGVRLTPSMNAGTPPQMATNAEIQSSFNLYKTGENAAIKWHAIGY